jgi:pimeloyl-ACP methyl ester carboxylesterase
MGEENIPLVFIHGLKGSTLVDDAGYVHFINLWQGLGFSSPKLALPIQWEGGKQKTDHLHAGEILHSIARFFAVYGPFLSHLHTLKRPTYTFPYDWRRDLNETAEKFQIFLREIYKKHNTKIQIVAHSMGGIITLASINTHNGDLISYPKPKPDQDNVKPDSGPSTASTSKKGSSANNGEPERVIDLVHSIIFAGCPFRTGVGFLQDLTGHGSPNGHNWKILSPSVLFTFPSIYTFFPTKDNSQIYGEDGKTLVPIDF